jgi:hypothetical protein
MKQYRDIVGITEAAERGMVKLKKPAKPRFGIFYLDGTGRDIRSAAFPGAYQSRSGAAKALLTDGYLVRTSNYSIRKLARRKK